MSVQSVPRQAKGERLGPVAAGTLVHAFQATVERLGDEVALRDPAREVELSWSDLRERSAKVAGGFAELGVGHGDTVALLLSNRWEFVVCDLGAVSLGAVPFSVYQTASAEQIQYVLGDSEAKVIVTEREYLERVQMARDALPELRHVVVVDGDDGDLTLADLEEKGADFDPTEAAAVAPGDLLTLIYTSGTTGPPKGVELTHRNLLTLVTSIENLLPLPDRGGKVVSWLPAAHIAERGAHYYLPLVRGLSITVCPDPKQVTAFLAEVKPTWFFAVPRIWEKMKSGLEAMLAGLPDEQRAPAERGLEAAMQKVRLKQSGEEVPEELAAAARQADEQLFAGLRARLGLDEAVAVNVGAAPTPVEVLEFFHAIGIPIGELWGMSETCGLVTINPPGRVKIGTVGPPAPGFEIRLAHDGEVLVRGDAVMAGYRNLPDKTAETIDADGWLATGDIGELDKDGYLKIVDRKKELIINAAGKNMSPAEIEGKLKASSPLIDQAVAIGDRRPYNVALIVLDPEQVVVWAEKQGLEETSIEALAQNDAMLAAVGEGVDAANQRMARVEQIKRFKVLPAVWEPGGDELTPTQKLKRKPIADKYADEIEALYSAS